MRARTRAGLLVRLERLEYRVAAVSQHHCKLRIGNLKRLPPEYMGERHVVISKHLPNEGEHERVEFEEVRGADPNPPQRANGAPPEYFDIHLVVPYNLEHDDGATHEDRHKAPPAGVSMSCSQMRKRVARLAAKICPSHDRRYTLEQLCRQMWSSDKATLLAMANNDCYYLRGFVTIFESEDARRGPRPL